MGQPDVLVDVTAFLSTPAIATIVAGVIGMSPGTPAVSLWQSISEALARPAVVSVAPDSGTPEPFIGPDPVGGGSSIDTIARLDGVTLLDQLVRLSPSELNAFVARHPEAIGDLTATPPAASSVADWWERTSEIDRSSLSTDLPGVVGNLEGVPYAVRDVANRAFLAATGSGIRAQLAAGVGRAMQNELEIRLHMLTEIEQALATGASGARRSLITLDVTGEGRAVVAVGDLATAEYVSYLVPGMYFGVDAQLVDWTATADAMLVEQQQWIAELGLDGDAATVSWIGYHTPTVVNASSMDLAYEGRDALTGSLDGIGATRLARGQAAPFVSVLAHSYGSTAAMLALQENDVTVDALAVVGSPGSPARSVDDLRVANGNVWVGAAAWDPIPRSGVYGSQPLEAAFGAHRFTVLGMTDPVTGTKLADAVTHNDYFAPGTTSQRNLALIALDQARLVSTLGGLAKSSAR